MSEPIPTPRSEAATSEYIGRLYEEKLEAERNLTSALQREAGLRAALQDYADRCPDCGGKGWYVFAGSMSQEPEQVQCQWCDAAREALESKEAVS